MKLHYQNLPHHEVESHMMDDGNRSGQPLKVINTRLFFAKKVLRHSGKTLNSFRNKDRADGLSKVNTRPVNHIRAIKLSSKSCKKLSYVYWPCGTKIMTWAPSFQAVHTLTRYWNSANVSRGNDAWKGASTKHYFQLQTFEGCKEFLLSLWAWLYYILYSILYSYIEYHWNESASNQRISSVLFPFLLWNSRMRMLITMLCSLCTRILGFRDAAEYGENLEGRDSSLRLLRGRSISRIMKEIGLVFTPSSSEIQLMEKVDQKCRILSWNLRLFPLTFFLAFGSVRIKWLQNNLEISFILIHSTI